MRNVLLSLFILVSANAVAAPTCPQLFEARAVTTDLSPREKLNSRLLQLALEAPQERAIGTNKDELERAIDIFTSTGFIGGRTHIYSLLYNVELRQSPAQTLGSLVTGIVNPVTRGSAPKLLERSSLYPARVLSKSDLQRTFISYLETNSPQIPMRARQMVEAVQTHALTGWVESGTIRKVTNSLRNPANVRLLTYLYEQTMVETIHAAVDAAPGRGAANWILLPHTSFKAFEGFAWGGVATFLAGFEVAPFISIAGFGAAMSGVIVHTAFQVKPHGKLRLAARARYLNERERFLQRATNSDNFETNRANAPELKSSELDPFKPEGEAIPLSYALQAAMSRSDLHSDLLAMSERKSKVEEALDEFGPLANLAFADLRTELSLYRTLLNKKEGCLQLLSERRTPTTSKARGEINDVLNQIDDRITMTENDIAITRSFLTSLAKALVDARAAAVHYNDSGLATHITNLQAQFMKTDADINGR